MLRDRTGIRNLTNMPHGSCIQSKTGSWKVEDGFSLLECHQVGLGSCSLLQDLVKLTVELQRELHVNQTSLSGKILPSFTLMGSVPEETRFGLNNELDIKVEFMGEIPTFYVDLEDPFHVYVPEMSPQWFTSSYTNRMGQFKLREFT